MSLFWIYFLSAAAAYLVGSLNGPLLASRGFLRDDIRKHGSGNAGATNVLRTYGVGWTAAVAVWDLGKGVAAIVLSQQLLPASEARYIMLLAGFFVITGHVFPFFFHFKGGKGVMTACAVMFTLDWQVASIALGLFLLLVVTARFVSLGSVCGVLSLPFLGLWFGRGLPDVGMYAAVAALIILVHRDNLKRLLKGTENRFSVKRRTP
ncbi:MAG: glycerol-3-phosphate 1-O-acyltransferase PlsY [Oscillospiraceae bacterium]|nr:glycerol-3-phosphate 1-O-acyltransferase PlsY [Oscillospiraceae bacterium]